MDLGEFREFMVPMSDGVRLYTAVCLPKGGGPRPILLSRTPYAGGEKTDPGAELLANKAFLAEGYCLVSQHVRGCGRSQGEFIPYENERRDGLDTLDWIRGQGFYGGEIHVRGSSYTSSAHLAYLDAAPPDVKGAWLGVQDCVRYNVLYRKGFFKTGLHGGWYIGMYKKNSLLRKNYCQDTFRMFPLSGCSRAVFGSPDPVFDECLRHPDPADAYWRTPAGGSEYRDAVRNSRIPILFTTAFHDIYTEGVLEMWRSLPEENRRRCALVVSPYAHDIDGEDAPFDFARGKVGEVWPNSVLNWFNHIRKGEPLRFAVPGQVTWYTLFENRWHSAPFIPEGARTLELHLNDRTLDPGPKPPREITYVYNPHAPAVFKGGCCNNFGGMQLQDPPDSRYDIVSFLSSPQESPIRIQGPASVRLAVRSDCEDTCFYVRLSIVNRNGEAYCLRDDIDSIAREHPDYAPGRQVDLHFDFAPHSFVLGKGERLRLDVSSSCYPLFQIHSNRKGLQCDQTSALVARNTICCGPSRLVLRFDPLP